MKHAPKWLLELRLERNIAVRHKICVQRDEEEVAFLKF